MWLYWPLVSFKSNRQTILLLLTRSLLPFTYWLFFIDKIFTLGVNSDTSPVSLNFTFKNQPKEFRSWRLDPTLLSEHEFCTVVSESITYFLATNRTEGVSPSLLCETLKVYLRLKIISYTAHIKKVKKMRHTELLKSISDLNKHCALSPSPWFMNTVIKLGVF